jgi:broad specificity phosphatase PhoE
MELVEETAALAFGSAAQPGDAPVEFFLARHGETEWNTHGRRQGQLDSPLTPAGVAQANRMSEQLAGRQIDGVFASPLGRALTTATICADRLRMPVRVLPALAEVDHGEWAGRTDPEIAEAYPDDYARRNADKYHFRFPGGESYADADSRAMAALVAIAEQRVIRPLVVSHEMLGRMLRRHLLGLTPEEALRWRQPNSVICRVRYDRSS